MNNDNDALREGRSLLEEIRDLITEFLELIRTCRDPDIKAIRDHGLFWL